MPESDFKLHDEKIEAAANSVDSASFDDTPTFDDKATRRLLRKLDVNIVPFLALLYLLSFLDRTNIGNARLAGLEASLGMTGLMYNNALAIFFPFYVAAEIPSNIMLKRTRPSFWIPFLVVVWAICTTCLGTVKTYTQLMVVRALLGVAEGGLFPGVTFYITMWYRRHECGLRMAVFFSAATAAGAFGGLLARGISEMNGVAGLAGWNWIFILEGLLTFVIAIISFWFIHDYPETAKFLQPEERTEVIRRLRADRTNLADEFDKKYIFAAFKDWKIWVHMLITIGIYIPLYSISLFLPTIVRNLGYTNEHAQLMTVPPYVVACVFCITGGFLADRYKTRGPFMIGFCLLAMLGFAMLLSSGNHRIQYTGTFFAASGIYANVPGGVAFNGNNIGGSTKRATGIAMHVGFGNLGGAIAAYIYQSKHAPRFIPGHASLLATTTMSCCLCIFMTIYLRSANKKKEAMIKEKGLGSPEDFAADREKGDDAWFFVYTP